MNEKIHAMACEWTYTGETVKIALDWYFVEYNRLFYYNII